MSGRISDDEIKYLKSLAHPESQLHQALTELEIYRELDRQKLGTDLNSLLSAQSEAKS